MQQRSIRKQLMRGLGYMALIVTIAFVALYFTFGSMESAKFIEPFHTALADAKTVELVEFDEPFPLFAGELVFKRAIATPAQIAELKRAADPFLAPIPTWHLFCWTPHHRVLVTRNDGRVFKLEVCFRCSNIETQAPPNPGKLGDIRSIPSKWRDRLRKLFTDAGMAPIDDYSERAKAHPGYQELEKAARKADEDFWPNPGGLPVSNP
jgi:hypothetical protein